MNIKEKLCNLTDEQIDHFWRYLLNFDCTGVDCRKCLFKCDSGPCLFLLIRAERTKRKTARNAGRLQIIRDRLANGTITQEEAANEVQKIFI
nr:MAG TPA: Short C-terminal domain [Caudoviricetes sp.]